MLRSYQYFILTCCLPDNYDCKTIDRDLKTTDVCWLNENKKYKGKMLWFDSWAKREMLYVDDIVRNGNVVPENELRIKSGALPDFLLKFHLIKNVFRMLKWQRAKRVEGTCNVEINRTLVQYCNAQNVVNWLVDERHIHSLTNRLKEQYWDNTFPNQIIDWQYIWSLPFLLKLDVKCCELHWKIAQSIYPTRVFLEKIKLVENNRCRYCNQIEFIDHFFVHCIAVKDLWLHVQALFNANQGVYLHLSVKDILLGYEHQDREKYSLLDKLILIAKMCISKFKYGEHPNLQIVFDTECSFRNV